MLTIPIPEIKFKDLGNPAFTIQTPENHISLHTILLAVAKKGSGKSYFITNLLNQFKESKCMDRIFCISDTFDSNKLMMKNLNIDESDVYSPSDPNCITLILEKINKERDDLLEYREKLKLWKNFKDTINKIDMEELDNYNAELLMFYNANTGNFEPPKHQWGGRRPIISIFADDIQSSPLIGNKQFKKFCIKHRHVASFKDGSPPIGCSLFIAVQNYTASGNEGIPKAIRGNINCIALWKSGNLRELDLITTELSGQIPKEKIQQAYDYVMNKDKDSRHNFLFVDLTKKKSHPSPFRMNYNEWIVLDP